MPSVSFGNLSKRRNSTLRPSGLSDTRKVKLKEATSIDNPTFIIQGNDFDYNYAKWDNRYYFVDNVVSRHDSLTEITCVLDVLATYKDEILASTQYVTYSNVSGGQFLVDTRIPVLTETHTSKSLVVNPKLSKSGTYILSVVGKNGCVLYKVTVQNIIDLLDKINDWSDDLFDDVKAGNYPWNNGQQATVYNFDTPENAIKSLGDMTIFTGLIGNAYADAPNCIRSCIWVPFKSDTFPTIASQEIYLGQFPTGVTAESIAMAPVEDEFTFDLQWHYNDWRRASCEDWYLYLPLVGLTNLNSDNLTGNSSVTIKYSISAPDGAIAYEVISGNQIIGSYGAACAAQIPLGISQQSSLGERVNSLLSGVEKMASMAVHSTVSPLSMGAVPASVYLEAGIAAYDTTNVSFTRHNSCIGGIGGGVGAGLDLYATIYDVWRETVIEPAQMAATMGVPTMKPLRLSSCHGYCQCANAHVAAPAQASELAAIDMYLNSGFYIE